jgi:hypothetical protein
MPRKKDLKRVVRTRMKKTGESYTAALAHVIKKPAKEQAVPPAPSEPPPPDYATLAGMSDDKVTAKTGCNWERWVDALDRLGADKMPHRDIAALVHEKYKIDGWWAQTVTVGYERIKGLREIGQLRSGSYEANKSKTFNVPVSVLFDAWANDHTRRRWLMDATPIVRTATRPKSMRLGWKDGTIVVVGFTPKGDARSVVALSHTKVPDRASADRLKSYWAERLDKLGEVLSGA